MFRPVGPPWSTSALTRSLVTSPIGVLYAWYLHVCFRDAVHAHGSNWRRLALEHLGDDELVQRFAFKCFILSPFEPSCRQSHVIDCPQMFCLHKLPDPRGAVCLRSGYEVELLCVPFFNFIFISVLCSPLCCTTGLVIGCTSQRLGASQHRPRGGTARGSDVRS